jgi:RNA polymerase sigma factor (sigma-70 family)
MKVLASISLLLLACYPSRWIKPAGLRYGHYSVPRGQPQDTETGIWDPMRPFASLVHLGCVTLPPLADQSDQAILRQLRKGDLRGLERLYRSYEGAVYSLGRRLCGNAHDADDVLQDTFVEVGRSIHLYRGEGPLLAWIKKICVNKALMRMRQSNRFTADLPEDCEELTSAPQSLWVIDSTADATRAEMEQVLEQLQPTARVVVWLHDVEGFTHDEIASLLRKTVSFSKSQLSRAHARLREWLGEKQEDPACDT